MYGWTVGVQLCLMVVCALSILILLQVSRSDASFGVYFAFLLLVGGAVIALLLSFLPIWYFLIRFIVGVFFNTDYACEGNPHFEDAEVVAIYALVLGICGWGSFCNWPCCRRREGGKGGEP